MRVLSLRRRRTLAFPLRTRHPSVCKDFAHLPPHLPFSPRKGTEIIIPVLQRRKSTPEEDWSKVTGLVRCWIGAWVPGLTPRPGPSLPPDWLNTVSLVTLTKGVWST